MTVKDVKYEGKQLIYLGYFGKKKSLNYSYVVQIEIDAMEFIRKVVK